MTLLLMHVPAVVSCHYNYGSCVPNQLMWFLAFHNNKSIAIAVVDYTASWYKYRSHTVLTYDVIDSSMLFAVNLILLNYNHLYTYIASYYKHTHIHT